jgi:pyrimidine-nucleoside phosphorylase
MNPLEIISKKRDGLSLTEVEISYMVKSFINGEVPDYQMASFLMAAYLSGLNREETHFLTRAIVDSGEIIDFSSYGLSPVDKHSTGGVGDKVTIALLPLVGSCGVQVCKMSGRALGHTGGTIDKLESIPGFKVALSIEEMISQVKKVGVVLSSATEAIAPADKKIYALRDATATVDSLPFIASSVMSKKIAGGARKVVLDIKVGKGAFVKEKERAEDLAVLMIDIGEKFGLKVSAYLTSMEEPLGFTVGNSIEVKEAIDTLKGRGPKDLEELLSTLASEMLILAGICEEESIARRMVSEAIVSGKALQKMREWIKAQGGDEKVIDDYNYLPRATIISEIQARESGIVQELDALKVAQAANLLGAGRIKKEDRIDHSVGIVCMRKVGDEVERGEPVFEVHANSYEKLDLADELLQKAVTIGEEEIEGKKLILKVLRGKNGDTS